jgi:SOS response regulatory protein OraA/RecX
MSAFITVTDAAGRVLFRRAASDAEVRDAVRAAEVAEAESEEAMRRIADERALPESLEADRA